MFSNFVLLFLFVFQMMPVLNSGGFSVDGSVGSVDHPWLLTTPMLPPRAPPGEESPEDREKIKMQRAALKAAALDLRSKNQIQNAENPVLSTPMKQQAPEKIHLG